MRLKPGTIAVLALALLALQGCDEKKSRMEPVALDARLTEIYGRTCAACHDNAETGAPQTHDMAAWKPRLAQGDAVLLDHAINGFGGMPPLGQCIECTAEDLSTLIGFMAGPPPEQD
ncbi:MAG TPA: c-type cytochrome [Parvibaculum sp.]|uniref:c-type cytochrome n=1 Tax=Parvibaculum sp. TaxID=2024848 RepID=UPI002D181D2B|nr:c-type cytochrome [Parvibaculum sp.]HMM15557.1 c-type cytochrome [Parvibaculum sp.]